MISWGVEFGHVSVQGCLPVPCLFIKLYRARLADYRLPSSLHCVEVVYPFNSSGPGHNTIGPHCGCCVCVCCCCCLSMSMSSDVV